jgi:uncharacterized iron-regulated membrane protein
MSLEVTLIVLAAGAALTGFCLWHQRRPRELGQVSLFPANMVMGIGLVVVIVALAHLVTLLTGHPLTGRMGQ